MLRLTMLLLCGLSGCYFFQSTPSPVPTSKNPGQSPESPLIIMLPGFSDSDKTFFDEGFIDIVRKSGIDAEVITTNAHLGYYRNKSVVRRIHKDVVLPAIKRGQRNIWLLGISMGGLGALLYLNKYPQNIRGVILVAPYMGDQDDLKPMQEFTTLKQWGRAQANSDDLDDIVRDVWLPMANSDCQSPRPIYILVGESDDLLNPNQFIASRCNNSELTVAPGGHDWNTWRTLWKDFLAYTSLSPEPKVHKPHPTKASVAKPELVNTTESDKPTPEPMQSHQNNQKHP